MNPSSPQSSPALRLRLRNIMVPVDFSECSLKALQYATAFARQFEASVTLVHVVQVYYGGGELGGINYPAMEMEMKDVAARQLAQLAADNMTTGIVMQTLLRSGAPAAEIAGAAKETNADMIIIATHGHTGLRHMLLGSVVENVIRHAPCPVLTVREREHEFISAT